MGCEGQRGRGRALLPPSQTGPGLRGRCRGPPWNPPEAQDCTLPRQHPGMEGDPGAQDGWWRPRLGGVGRGCLTFRSALGRWPACRIDPRARIVGKL
ncbi:uncharacterized protein LOC143169782 isoform X4 [Aptenodytes patagonicus]|uniref:uncharacterized protein LOC143169782 isoform X4 n=1 Tax=Aptenodytes patagonicus TaxID=9234 RepID=UPI003FA0C62A